MMYLDNYIKTLKGRCCGEQLEYSSEFIELENILSSTYTVEYGEYIYTSDPIDWGHVESLCKVLHERTLDLRVSVWLARSLLERKGIIGFIGGLKLICWLLQERWSTVHPQLVTQDNFDPLIRINTLSELAVPATIITVLKRQVLATADNGEVLYLGGLEAVSGPECDAQHRLNELLVKLIEPRCSTELMRNLGHIKDLHDVLEEISSCLEEKTGINGVTPFQRLSQASQKWARVIEDRLRSVEPKFPTMSNMEQVSCGIRHIDDSRLEVYCQSREDVVRALDAICQYYLREEPSSPVPFLIARVRRLTSMSFIDIIEELAPDSVSNLRSLGGSVTS